METPTGKVDNLCTTIDRSCWEGFVIASITKKTFWTLIPLTNVEYPANMWPDADTTLQRREEREGEGKVT